MTDETLAEILSGLHDQSSRADLHAALDELLDDADANAGQLDGPAFWGFVAGLARGRNVADEIADAAANQVVSSGGLPDEPTRAWRTMQWALLSALMRRVTAFPGELTPKELSGSAFLAVAQNVLSGPNGGEVQDLLGLETQRGAAWEAEARAAKRLLVGAVNFRAAQTRQSVARVRAAMLPDVPQGTWKDWTREVSRAKRVTTDRVGDDARASAEGRGNPFTYDLDADAVARLLRTAWRPNA